MGRIARIAARVAQIQQDNLLDVHNFVDRSRIRMMVMEWVDGFDLRRLLVNDLVEKVRDRVSTRRCAHHTSASRGLSRNHLPGFIWRT